MNVDVESDIVGVINAIDWVFAVSLFIFLPVMDVKRERERDDADFYS